MFTIISLLGAVLLLTAFGLLSFNVIEKGYIYNVLNLVGSDSSSTGRGHMGSGQWIRQVESG
jgi:hypothetical protein